MESPLCVRRPKYWSFSFSISPPNEYSGLISFRMDWLYLLQSKGHSRVFSRLFPELESISSSVLSLPYGSTLTSVHDYWKNHSLDSMDLCWQNGLCFLTSCRFCHSFSSKEQASFNFMAAVPVHSDFKAQEDKNLSLFPFFLLLFAMKSWDQMP